MTKTMKKIQQTELDGVGGQNAWQADKTYSRTRLAWLAAGAWPGPLKCAVRGWVRVLTNVRHAPATDGELGIYFEGLCDWGLSANPVTHLYAVRAG